VQPDASASPDTVRCEGATFFNSSATDLLCMGHDVRVKNANSQAVKQFGLFARACVGQLEAIEESLARVLGSSCAVHNGSAQAALNLISPAHLVACSSDLVAGDWRLVSSRGMHEGDTVVIQALRIETGSLQPLPQILFEAQRAVAKALVIDEHTFGILGATGAGSLEHFQIVPQSASISCDLSALGIGLGVLAGNVHLVEAMKTQRSHPTAVAICTAQAALVVLKEEPHRRERLFALSERLISSLRGFGFDTGPCVTPYISVWSGNPETASRWLQELLDAKIAAKAWLSPSQSRLSFSLAASTSDAQLDQLVTCMESIARRFGIPEVAARFRGPVAMARPGTNASMAPCAQHWGTAVEEVSSELPRPIDEVSLQRKVLGRLEEATWRLVNSQSGSLRRSADGLRLFLTGKKR
jgi:hypothetical protein